MRVEGANNRRQDRRLFVRELIAPHAHHKLKGWSMRHACVRVFHILVSVAFLSLIASGQEFPKTEMFGGYSYLHVDTQGVSGSSLAAHCTSIIGSPCPLSFQVHPGFNGWYVGGQLNVNSWFGLKADFAGHYGNLIAEKFTSIPPLPPLLSFSTPNQHIYDFLFGPVLSHRSHSYTAFAHGLIGAERFGFGNFQVSGITPITLPGPASHTNFAFAVGGGLDFKVTRHLSVRAGQFDYEFVKSAGNGRNHQNDFRFAAGVVYGFGGK
jgi:opacity protein-like surface antigen